MAMAHSVEARYPFLDHRVVEFAAKLHPTLKMHVLNEKYLLKRAAKDIVPDSIISRPKQPYRAPDGKSFFGREARDYVDELLAPETITRGGLFQPRSVAMLLSKFRSGRAIGTKDNMALVSILSTQMLVHKFLKTA